MAFSEDDRVELRRAVRDLMDRVATADYVRQLDREQRYPEALYQAWVETGLLKVPFPEELGGLGGGLAELIVIAEELAKTSYDLYAPFGGAAFLGIGLLRKGTRKQREYWLPRLMEGEIKFALCMSEPEAGSDVTAIRTKAERTANGWRINGTKVWATGAGGPNTVIQVYARTDPDVSVRSGLSLFLVENDRPGVTLNKLDMLGRRSTGTYEVIFDDVEVPDDRIVGGVNEGWACMMSTLLVERITGTAAYCGNAGAIVDITLDYAKQRNQFGKPIGSFQAIAHLLADMKTDAAAARALTYDAVARLEAGEDARAEVSMAKLFASEALVRISNNAMQIFGANGYSMDYDIQRFFRDARSSTIAGGSSQIQRNTIAREMGLRVS
jgi:alkylation response protein AidB-like acyl-CoA dehydrogenase